MLEILLGVAVCIASMKVADADGMSGGMWFGIAFLICFLSVTLIPLPFIRMLIAGVLVICAMVGYKFYAERPN
ncbi:MAG: hypothetical protein CMJ19_10325 [Phycisphaeraceae bacterium]|nr:hypothetical protein [Phycisphaeraceae bacterium]